MTYNKPEVEVLGNASNVILGGIPKQMGLEPNQARPQFPVDCEFDD